MKVILTAIAEGYLLHNNGWRGMTGEQPDIIFFRIPLCGKCKQVAANLAQVKKNRPQVKLEVYIFPSHIDLARKNGIHYPYRKYSRPQMGEYLLP